MNRDDYVVLTPLAWFPHLDPSDLLNRSLDAMSSVTPCHVPRLSQVTTPRLSLVIATLCMSGLYLLSHCNTLQYTATHCNTLQHIAGYWLCCAYLFLSQRR